ncbi:MAG: hypothetical protein ACLU0O_01060 [Collinsella sp.]
MTRGVSGSTAARAAAGTRRLIVCPCVQATDPSSERCSAAITWSMTWLPRAAPVVDGVTYVTPDGARVSYGGLVRVGLDAGEASGALERKRRIRELEA